MSLHVDGNINIVRNEGKIPQIVKYLEFYIFEKNKYFPAEPAEPAETGASEVEAADAEAKLNKEKVRVSNVAMVVSFSRLIPADSWNTALLTCN